MVTAFNRLILYYVLGSDVNVHEPEKSEKLQNYSESVLQLVQLTHCRRGPPCGTAENSMTSEQNVRLRTGFKY